MSKWKEINFKEKKHGEKWKYLKGQYKEQHYNVIYPQTYRYTLITPSSILTYTDWQQYTKTQICKYIISPIQSKLIIHHSSTQLSLLAPVGEVVISGADIVVYAWRSETKNSSLKWWQCIVQKLLESHFCLNWVGASCCLDTPVVTRAGESSSKILSTEARIVEVIGEQGPNDLSIFE